MIGFRAIRATAPLGLLLVVGCQDGSFSMHYHDDRPRPVVERRVHVDHYCDAHCNHYYDGDRVIVIRERHVHGPGCGHFLDGRRWVIVRGDAHPVVIHKDRDRHIDHGPPPRKVVVREHRHDSHCGCVYDRAGSKWLVVGHGHVHGPRCGHVYVSGRWSSH